MNRIDNNRNRAFFKTRFGVPSITGWIYTRKISFYGNFVNQVISCTLYLLEMLLGRECPTINRSQVVCNH